MWFELETVLSQVRIMEQAGGGAMSGLSYGSLFSGYGGLDLAVEQITGAECVWQSEIDPNASTVLAHHWPQVPNHGDISSIDWADVAPVDILCGGFPCQDISSAGKQAGIKEGTRSGLWFRYADAIRVLRPRLVFVENVAALVAGGGLGVVAGSLAEVGYGCRWISLRASDVGACHRRERVFLVAWPADAEGDPWRIVNGGSDAPSFASDLGHERPRRARDGWPGPADSGASTGPVVDLLPTPSASNPNDGEDLAGWAARNSTARRLVTPPTGVHAGDTLTDAATIIERAGGGRFGPYAVAVGRWELVTQRAAPCPTDIKGRLSPLFVEWMMGCAEGHVTGHGLTRSAELKMLGNGVVTLQAATAFSLMLDELAVAS